MIRMGRSSKTEQPTNTPTDTTQRQTPSFQYNNEMPSQRAVSDSDSIARDIKEGRLSGFVGHGTVLTGEATFQAMLRIDGHLTGQITSEGGTLIVGSTGQVDANIAVAAAVINGTVNGDIIVSEKLELGHTARVIGNIQTPRLLMDDGAILEGSCSMLKAREDVEKHNAEINSHPTIDKFSSYQMNGFDEESDLAEYEQTKENTETIVN